MIAKNKSHHIAFRVADYEWELIQDEAKRRKLSEGQVARAVVLETLAGFDQKQESFLRRFDKQDELLELLINISSLGAGAAALPFDDNQDVAELREMLKRHILVSVVS
jgi:hypothetical protein